MYDLPGLVQTTHERITLVCYKYRRVYVCLRETRVRRLKFGGFRGCGPRCFLRWCRISYAHQRFLGGFRGLRQRSPRRLSKPRPVKRCKTHTSSNNRTNKSNNRRKNRNSKNSNTNKNNGNKMVKIISIIGIIVIAIVIIMVIVVVPSRPRIVHQKCLL